MKPTIRAIVITIASVGMFIIIFLTKSTHHQRKWERTFFQMLYGAYGLVETKNPTNVGLDSPN